MGNFTCPKYHKKFKKIQTDFQKGQTSKLQFKQKVRKINRSIPGENFSKPFYFSKKIP